MKQQTYKKIVLGLVLGFAPLFAIAHQPRIAAPGAVTVITDPEISKAYYGRLEGEPAVYTITSETPFHLYVNVLVPDIAGQKKDVSAAIIKDGKVDAPIAVLEGTQFAWEKFFEEYGHDTYWRGPEYKNTVPGGSYEIRVWSSNNDSKYSLAVGEIEAFGLKEGVNALARIPEIKKDFFNESPATFLLSPIGAGYALVVVILGFFFGVVGRIIIGKVLQKHQEKIHKNIGMYDRVFRIVLGVVLIWVAVLTTWNPALLILGGFCLYEGVVGWCGLYALAGKSTCPAE